MSLIEMRLKLIPIDNLRFKARYLGDHLLFERVRHRNLIYGKQKQASTKLARSRKAYSSSLFARNMLER